ncbi:MAG: hypothetical protein LBK60_08000 [Verrucomicrobiales bacterium]|jgi:hypothetical protein|nr:hypothetical protein [Verrucomicrobiales bacterium]
MARIENDKIVCEVLQVASAEVLGESKPLEIAASVSQGNAQGELYGAESYHRVIEMAGHSARNFIQAMQLKRS